MYVHTCIYVYICSHKEHTSGSEVCVWLHMGIFICIFTYTHTSVYSIHVCVHVCAHTCTRGHSQAYARTSTCTLRTSRAAAWERLTRVLATAIGAALFNKDGHETQDAVAPAGQGPQLCSAEHVHGQTGMSSRRSESKQRGRVSEGGSSGAHEPAATRRPRRAAGHGGGRAGQRGHHDSGWPRSIRAAAVLCSVGTTAHRGAAQGSCVAARRGAAAAGGLPGSRAA